MKRTGWIILIAVVVAALAAFSILRLSCSRPSTRHPWVAEETASLLKREFPALHPDAARALEAELLKSRSFSELEATAGARRPQYMANLIRRKLAGEIIDPEHYAALLRMIGEHPKLVAVEDLRGLLSNASEQTDRDTYITCLRAMGNSGNAAYLPDVRAQLFNYWALQPYAELGRSAAIPDLLRVALSGPETRMSGAQSLHQMEGIVALGLTGDPAVLPILNHLGEHQQVHRKAVERALVGIDDPAAATVAANMLSLPTDYPSAVNVNEGRWHSNEHSSARNVLLEQAKKLGVPRPSTLSQDDLRTWWEANKSAFPDLDVIRSAYPEARERLQRRATPGSAVGSTKPSAR